MSRRSGVIASRNLPVQVGCCGRAGAVGADGDRGRGLEPLGDGSGQVVAVPGWGAAGSGMTFTFHGRGAASSPATAE
jgi:hypothetical protein